MKSWLKKCLVSIVLIVGIFSLSWSQKKDDKHCGVKNTAFQVGEQIRYKVYYHWGVMWMNAGYVQFTVDPGEMLGQSAYHITAIGRTYRSYDYFYKVRDTYQTYLSRRSMKPLKFVRDVYEGGYIIDERITFYHSKNEAIEVKGNKKPKSYEIPNCIQDVLSGIYATRCIDFTKYQLNDTIPITIFLDRKIYPLYIRYMGKEVIKSKFGKVRCVKFRPLLIEGTIFEGGEEMVVWATDDKNKIPIRVRSPIVVGEVRAEIESYEGLRHKFKAKLE